MFEIIFFAFLLVFNLFLLLMTLIQVKRAIKTDSFINLSLVNMMCAPNIFIILFLMYCFPKIILLDIIVLFILGFMYLFLNIYINFQLKKENIKENQIDFKQKDDMEYIISIYIIIPSAFLLLYRAVITELQ